MFLSTFVVNSVMSLKKRMELVKRQFGIARTSLLCQAPVLCVRCLADAIFNQDVFFRETAFPVDEPTLSVMAFN